METFHPKVRRQDRRIGGRDRHAPRMRPRRSDHEVDQVPDRDRISPDEDVVRQLHAKRLFDRHDQMEERERIQTQFAERHVDAKFTLAAEEEFVPDDAFELTLCSLSADRSDTFAVTRPLVHERHRRHLTPRSTFALGSAIAGSRKAATRGGRA